MQPECELAIHLQDAISAARLSSYADAADQSLIPAVARYAWNTQLCEALYPALHGVEVALRNRVDTHMRSIHGDLWFDTAGVLLVPDQAETLKGVRSRLKRDNIPETHDRLIAELNFGFWTGMLAQPYERTIWQTAVATVFPGVPRHMRTRSALASRLNDIRKLRNRMSHHESIWRRPHLDKEYACALETLSWIAPALHQTVLLIDRFPSTLAAGPLTHENAVAALGSTWTP
jgi:hypothetical protein